MPLTGFVDGQRLLSCLTPADKWDELTDRVRRKTAALTLRCGLPGHCKVSRAGTQFFAHNPGGDGCTKGETAEHLLAKSTIIRAAAAAGWDAEDEVGGHDWRADVMVTRGSVRIAIEVQWTRQSAEIYRIRTQRYLDAGLARCAWFARHLDGVPTNDPSLPVFHLDKGDDENLRATIAGTTLPLHDATTALLTGNVRHRTTVTGTADAIISTVLMKCWNCPRWYVVWRLEGHSVTGACGYTAGRGSAIVGFARDELSLLPSVRQAAHQWASSQRMTLASSGGRWQSLPGAIFSCPWCGRPTRWLDTYEALNSRRSASWEVKLPNFEVTAPHWCLRAPTRSPGA